ncbi:MAG: transglutaminase family protein [Deltaproteobacteria bacterium]|nr:transglutaminase family protein [Deltaproteobacteria bacterium]
MLYRVKHVTHYRYSEPVSLCHNEAHLLPRSLSHQRCLDAHLHIAPRPAVYHERKDFFGNRVVYFSIEESHATLEVTASSEMQLSPIPVPELGATPPWEHVQTLLRHEENRGALEARQFVLDSPFVETDGSFAEYARASFAPGLPLLAAVHDLMRRIFTEFTYDPEFTTIATPVSEVFAHKRGVCQDFAHFAIACLRSLGLAARYVSGYLETMPRDGQSQLIGAAASHAWVSVYCPQLGWVDFDPTNDLMPSDRHIVVAWGRDYSDVTPLKGTILGGVEHKLKVAVAVNRVEENESGA